MYYPTSTYDYKLATTNDGEAHISVQRNRIKNYDNQVYLKDKQEFEIELFNPSFNTKAVEISINGKIISTSKLVLKPGQRVYLERFIDTAKKFLFETYEVENSDQAKAAILNNGEVEIRFYDESTTFKINYTYNGDNWYYNQGFPQSVNSFYSDSSRTFNFSGSGGGMKTNSLTRSSSVSQDSLNNSLETGRIEKGEDSKQRFTSVNKTFNAYTSNIVKLKILPFSLKPLEIKELLSYCTECGAKQKKNWKFCPNCGTKY